MKKFKSCFSYLIERFIEFRKASGSWNESGYGNNIRFFDRFCADNYPEDTVLTQTMVDTWCAKRSTETNGSNVKRTQVVRLFVDYLRHRGFTDVTSPPRLKHEPRTYIPHPFEEYELQRFFNACDQIQPGKKHMVSMMQKLTIPVFFRLLYSTGMRVREARLLKRKDVDIKRGVIDIQNSKGYDQRYVALHDSMSDLMLRYDKAIAEMQPFRDYFFQSPRGACYSSSWVSRNFRRLWIQANGTSSFSAARDLRHHYAISNINSWAGDSFCLTDKLQYLSKSLGHRSIESTLYYYSLIPRMANTLREKTEAGFNIIVPEATW